MSYGAIGGSVGSLPGNSYPLLNAGRNNGRLVNLMICGDSRTLQNNDTFTWPTTYRFHMGYAMQALSMVRERFRFRETWNLGANGGTIAGFDTDPTTGKAVTVPPVLASRPAYEEWDAVLFFGINDALGGISAAAYAASLKSVVKYLQDKGVRNIYLMGEVPYPSGYLGESGGTHATRIALLKSYNTEIYNLCSKVPGLWFVENYASYGSSGDPDVSDPLNNGTDIHPGSRGATILAENLARIMIAVRGMFPYAPGVVISTNPTLIDVETITAGGTVNSFYGTQKTSGVSLARAVGDRALVVSIDSTDGTPRNFEIFNSATSWAADVMPGDIVQGCMEIEYLTATGAPVPVGVKILEQTPGTAVAYGNWTGGSYTRGIRTGLGKQIYMTDPHLMASGKAGKAMQVCMLSGALANTAISFKVYELSTRRIYTTPNAEYSAAATVPLHRKNIKCLTSTASAAFALTLQPFYSYDDGDRIRFEDYEGAAGTKNVTITCAGSDVIRTAGSTAATKIISTNYGAVNLRVDRGANAFVVE